MSGNPYIDVDGYLDDGLGPVRGTRTSVLAVSSLASSLVCCIPFLGVLSIVMGSASLLLIGKSNGRLTGRGAAIAGLIVGIMTTVIWGALGAGGLQSWTFYKKQIIPVAESTFSATQTNDVATVRSHLNATADAELTDEQIQEFMAVCNEEFGTIHSVSGDIETLWESFVDTMKRSQGNNRGGGGQFDEMIAPAPVAIEASEGRYFVWLLFDADSLKGQQDRKLADILLMQDGRNGISLRKDGPGRDMGDALSLRTRTAEEATEWIMTREKEQKEETPDADAQKAPTPSSNPD